MTSRGVRRSRIYLDDRDRRRFLQILAAVTERYDIGCHAYCEMTNHYHLALTTRQANLSRAMQQLNSDYAQWWNWRHDRAGHVFEARFQAQVVQDGRYLAHVCRYIVLNPVRARMVAAPEDWPWSSYRAMIGIAQRPPFLETDWLLGRGRPGRPGGGLNPFRDFVSGADARTVRLSQDPVLGDDGFVARFQRYHNRADRDLPQSVSRRSLSTIFDGVVSRTARSAAIRTALSQHYTMADIARFLGVHSSTVSKIVTKGGVRP